MRFRIWTTPRPGREEGRREVRLVFIHKLFTTYLYSNHRKDLD